jgi:LysR family nitrogen assimilation transcriptional regulator
MGLRPLDKVSTPLDFRRLRYFIAIKEHGSLSGAARALRVAQPALTYHVAELERNLGITLLKRVARGVELTEAGTVFLRHARLVVSAVARAEESLHALRHDQGRRTIVRLGLIPSVAITISTSLMAKVAQALPGTTLSIVEGGTDQLEDMLRNDKLDMALTLGDLRRPRTKPILREALFLVSKHPRQKPLPETITFAEISKLNLILPTTRNPLRRLVDDAADRAGFPLTVSMEIDGQDSIKRAVAKGAGSTILSWHAAREEHVSGTLLAQQIVEPQIGRLLVLEHVEAADPHVSTLQDLLVDLLEERPGPKDAR